MSVSGKDRLAWDQRAGSLSVASSYTYWIYVDGSRKRLDDVRCSAGSSRGRFVCSAPLPHLAPGRHVLELSTSTEASGADEGPRSQPIDVVVS